MNLLRYIFAIACLLVYLKTDNLFVLGVGILFGFAAFSGSKLGMNLRKKNIKQQIKADSKPRSEADKIREFAEVRRNELCELSSFPPLLSLHVGGVGMGIRPGETVFIGATNEKIIIFSAVNEISYEIMFSDLTTVEISGPGTQVADAGLVGGGFGIEGAVKGIIAAAVVNAATKKSTTNTFLRFATNKSEAFFHFNDQEPSVLRLILSPVVVAVDANKKTNINTLSVADEIIKLQSLKESGVITSEEFNVAKIKLLE